MVSADIPGPDAGGSLFAASQRVRKRRWAETRLQVYGILAILTAALALVALLGSVVVKATGALTESYLVLDVTLDPGVLGIEADADTGTIRRADFDKLTTATLRARFPEATGRSERRVLGDLVSGGAPFELADMVAERPELLGQTIAYPFLASDTADLYLQGRFGRFREEDVSGALTVIEGDGDLEIASTAPDFVAALARVRLRLLDDADKLRVKAARQQNAVRVYGEQLAEAGTEAEQDRLRGKLGKAEAARDELLGEADVLVARAEGGEGSEPLDDDNLSYMIRAGGGWIRLTEIGADAARGEALTAVALPVEASGDWSFHVSGLPESRRKIGDHQIAWIETLQEQGQVERVFNTRFFTGADSRAPELAGIWGAAVGSFWTMLVTFLLAFPVGVLSAIYLEEFAPKNRFTNFIEVNINNLAAVPSIIFGLLGLSIFLGVFGVPRSAPLAGGIVLALMTLPTIIIASRVSMAAVPPSIREAALGVGASQMQTAFHHVLPLAMPGVLTGSIIGMARALGETAPLITIGMVAFIVDVPSGITDSATVLPVQIYRWSDFPEQAFEARTAAAICVLLVFLVLMNAIAIVLRRRFERRW